MFVVWNLTTVLGFVVFSNAGDLITDLGLDVAGPAAFLALLWPRLADRRQLVTAAAGATIAVAVVPVVPAGVPILMSMLGEAAGPLVLGARRLPLRVQSLVDLLPSALLASLAIVSTVGDGNAVVLDARLVGLIVAGVALWRRAPFVVVIVVASAATAIVRALG